MNRKKDARIYSQKSRSKIEGKNFNAAFVDYSRAIRLNKNHIRSLDGMGDALLEQEKHKEALLFKKIVMMMPKHAVAYYNVALVLDKLGKTDESLKMYKEAIRLDPTDPDGHINLAILLAGRESYEEAGEYYLKVKELRPSDAYLVTNGIGCLYFAQGILIKAKEEFQKSVGLDGKFTHAYCNMSLILFCEKKSEEALKYFEDGMKTLEDEGSKIKTIKEIMTSYTDHKTRLEAKLDNTVIYR